MENTFRVGYGRRTVTPTEPIPLAGFSNELKRFHTRVTEPICVTCVARFQCGMGETVADTYNQMLKELK